MNESLLVFFWVSLHQPFHVTVAFSNLLFLILQTIYKYVVISMRNLKNVKIFFLTCNEILQKIMFKNQSSIIYIFLTNRLLSMNNFIKFLQEKATNAERDSEKPVFLSFLRSYSIIAPGFGRQTYQIKQ